MHKEIYVKIYNNLHLDGMSTFLVNCIVNGNMYHVGCGTIIGEGMLFCASLPVFCGLLQRIVVAEFDGSLDTLIWYNFQKRMTYNTKTALWQAFSIN